MNNRVAILTIVSYNFGNRLQNYALQTVISELGYEVETIQRNKLSPLKKFILWLRNRVKRDKFYKIDCFNKNIHWSDYLVDNNSIPDKLSENYDCFVIGSDQIWNPTFYFNSENDYLPGIDKSKKIAYAASFGLSNLSDEIRIKIHPLLEDIAYISMRELRGAEIVEEIIGSPVPCVVDPTLLLSADEWENVERFPKSLDISDKYFLAYFIGECQEIEKLEFLSKKYNMRLITLESRVAIDPFEFVYLIHHAELVFTDSFHGTVFSFLFDTPVIIYDRISKEKDMNSRLDTLCIDFGLNDRRRSNINMEKDNIFSSDYHIGKQNLNKFKEFSIDYLKETLQNAAKNI